MPTPLLRRTDGNALVEVALFLPLLVLMLLGVVDYGVLLNDDLRVMDSARSAAEAATTYTNGSNMTLVTQVGTAAAAGIPGYAISTTQYCLCGPGTSQVSCALHSVCGSYGIPNQYVQVTATAQLPLILHIAGFGSTLNVKSVAVARTAWTGTN
jgi:Flp pilus assembly protein TadG